MRPSLPAQLSTPDVALREGTTPPSEEESAIDRDALRGVLEFPDPEPTPSEKASLDEDGQACWQHLLGRRGATLGIGGDSTPPSEEACADLVRDLTELGATNWRSFLTRYQDELWPTGEDDGEAQ